jgi:hypothetical protein
VKTGQCPTKLLQSLINKKERKEGRNKRKEERKKFLIK